MHEQNSHEDKNAIKAENPEDAGNTKYFNYKVQKDFVAEDIKMAKRKKRGVLYIFLLVLLFIVSLYPIYKHFTDLSGGSLFSQLKYANAHGDEVGEESPVSKSDGTKYQAFIGNSENGEVSYKIYKDSLSFTETRDACKLMGGELLAIADEEEYDKVLSLMDGSDAKFFWFGICTDKKGNIVNLNGKTPDFFPWKEARPVSEKTVLGDRKYIIFFKNDDGEWVYNLTPNDPTASCPELFKNNIAYICKFAPKEAD